MPVLFDLAGPFPVVLTVMEHEALALITLPSQFAPLNTTGFVALASLAWMLVRVSRRCTACVPTYPASTTQSLPSACCSVRFHCWVLGATKLRGTVKPKMNCEGSTPGLPLAQP